MDKIDIHTMMMENENGLFMIDIILEFSLVETGLLVHWLVSPSCTEFSLVHL